jgi:transcriptional regulator with XRE-family HTH domain
MARKRPEDLLVRVGARLRLLREQRGLTQEQVGERAGYTAKYISEIERGRRDPPLTTLALIAEKGLGCDLADVVAEAARRRGSSTRKTATETYVATRPLPPAVYELAEQIAGVSAYHARVQLLAMIRSAIALARGNS